MHVVAAQARGCAPCRGPQPRAVAEPPASSRGPARGLPAASSSAQNTHAGGEAADPPSLFHSCPFVEEGSVGAGILSGQLHPHEFYQPGTGKGSICFPADPHVFSVCSSD